MTHERLACPLCNIPSPVKTLSEKELIRIDEIWATYENQPGPGRGHHEHKGGFKAVSRGSWRDFKKAYPEEAKAIKARNKAIVAMMKKAGMI